MHLVENKDTLKYAINIEIKGLIDGLFPSIRRRENWRLALAAGDGRPTRLAGRFC